MVSMSVRDKAEWSDKFFVFVEAWGIESLEELKSVADSFLLLYPRCPYTMDWLMNDYQARL